MVDHILCIFETLDFSTTVPALFRNYFPQVTQKVNPMMKLDFLSGNLGFQMSPESSHEDVKFCVCCFFLHAGRQLPQAKADLGWVLSIWFWF